jgi:tetratricopeptide (TPR) repeat protein
LNVMRASVQMVLNSRRVLTIVFALSLSLCSGIAATGQTENSLDDNASDPTKLFERGQNAHARGDLERALEFYEEAIKVKPEFPEAEFQRGSALMSLKRFNEAEAAFRRAIELKSNWAMPKVNLGVLLVRLHRDTEAEPVLRQALMLDGQNELALRVLSDLRLRSKDPKEALELSTKASTLKDATNSSRLVKAMAERALGMKKEAAATLESVLATEPQNVAALLERGELHLENNAYADAVNDFLAAHRLEPTDKAIASRLASAYERDGKPDEARKIAESAGLITSSEASGDGIKVIGTPEEIKAANSEDSAESKKSLEALLVKNPRNAMLLARLGAASRTDNPAQSLEYYRRAAEFEPKNPDYAVGYASALVQARRFEDASKLLRSVIAIAPEHYAAHANLATALYEQKSFAEALSEYDWILKKKPDVVVAYYFIATAHDNLGEYPEALTAYEAFIARAEPQKNQLEIEKVKLRLPLLRRQIQLGQGVKKKSKK